MRTSFRNHNEVCHVWASRSQDYGCSGNIEFKGDSIYSYRWWEMARFYETKSGKKYCFIRSYAYSSSTGRHMSYVKGAIPDYYEKIYVDGAHGVLLDHYSNKRSFVNKMEELNKHFKRSKNPVAILNEIQGNYDSLKKYCQIFKLKLPKDAKKFLIEYEDVRHFIKHREEIEEKRKKREEERNEILRLKYHEEYKEWNNGEVEVKWMVGVPTKTSQYIPGYGLQKFSQVRLRIKDNEVETSMGAFVPVREAKVLWDRIKKGKDIKGFLVGRYTVIGINGTLQIGCHHITREEITRFTDKYDW